MCKVTETLIARVENAIYAGASPEDIVELLKSEGIEDYDTWLAFKAAEVSIRLFANM